MLETALFVLVNTLLKSLRWIFTKLTPVMYYGTEINTLIFGVKGSQFKVTVK